MIVRYRDIDIDTLSTGCSRNLWVFSLFTSALVIDFKGFVQLTTID